jgi:1,4-dihydroxy-2-naphthoyl-CoA hydrolase
MSEIGAKARRREYSGHIAFAIEEKTAELVRGRMPIAEGILNPFGTVHAGAMLWFADVVATVLAIGDAEIGPDGKGFPLAITLNAQLLANRRAGDLLAEARLVRRGKRLIVVRTEVKGEDGALLLDVTTTHLPA